MASSQAGTPMEAAVRERPTVWAITRARRVRVYPPNAPGCYCVDQRVICDAHWAIARELDQAFWEGRNLIMHGALR